MYFSKKGSELYSGEADASQALSRTTDLCIAAHHDDIEIMAFAPIAKCIKDGGRRFTGVVVSDGGGSPRAGAYGSYTDEEMKAVRVKEQKLAADIGDYAALALLNFTSAEIKNPENSEVVRDIKDVILRAAPQNIYTHALSDKHDTHVAVCLRVISALRKIPADKRPERLYGMEVWRGLDWLCDKDKVVFDTSGYPNIAAALIGVYDSQISGGKRYDLAAIGRRSANATFLESHHTDDTDSLSFGMDMTRLINDDSVDIAEFAASFIQKFAADVNGRIARLV